MRKLLWAILILACAPWAGAAYLGDYADDETVHFTWSSYDGDGASVTRATDGTISVYKDGGVTQSTLGVTDTEDFDSLTGIHSCDIYTTHTFYATGADYSVVLSASTIDGNVVNAVLAEFSIQNRYMRGTNSASLASALTTAQGNITTILSQVGDLYLSRVLVDTTIASAGRAVTTLRLTEGSDQNDAYNGMWVILDSNEGDGVYVSRHISDYDGSNKQVTFTPAVIHDPVDGGLVYIVPGPVHQNTNLDTLLARLTALRAGYLDNLSAGAVAQAAALTTHDSNMATSNALVISTGSTGPWTSADVSGVATAGALTTHDGKLDTVDDFLDTEIAAIYTEIINSQGTGFTSATHSLFRLAALISVMDNLIDNEIADIQTSQALILSTGSTGPWTSANVSALATDAALTTHVALVISTGSTGPWTTGGGGADQTTTNTAILDAIENATYGLSAIRTRGDAAWVTGGGGADQTTTNTAILTAIENATYGLSAIRTRGDAAWVTGGGTDVSTTATATLAAVLAQNDPSVAEIVVGVLAGVVDGTIDVETAIYRILATTYNDATTTPGQIVYLNSAGDDTVSTRTITGTGWSSTP